MVGLSNLHKQRGLSLSGLILALILVAIAAVLGMQVVPAVVEFQSIKKAATDARDRGTSAPEIEAAYNKIAVAGYITSVSGKDLTIVKEDGVYQVSFAYEKKLPLFGPASLLLEFSGSTDKH
ncbi:DUF4845 domain-containing protein [Solimicrobium silvestre]|uniref:DUF4845 domain-containing protein n=1 Tax=Solimicrobium silvestre TaxID=2099400 RepID=A0A2S9GY05_9BURK|nr:DUF4845 domain-containing protein [Solimicrobium silvestre]PRC92607.1 hypothetical protein S2091_2662 [Solimicrobium silvestre]